MILVREHHKLAGHFSSLQHIEHCQTLRDGQAVIKFVVNDLERG